MVSVFRAWSSLLTTRSQLTLLVLVSAIMQLSFPWHLYPKQSIDADRGMGEPPSEKRRLQNTENFLPSGLHEVRSKYIPRARNITLIVETRGEMGNQLNSIAHALRIKHWIETQYPFLTVQLSGEHPGDPRWQKVWPVLRQCFPVIRENMYLSEGGSWFNQAENAESGAVSNLSRYERIEQTQYRWLEARGFVNSTFHMDSCPTPLKRGNSTFTSTQCWKQKLDVVLKMHKEQDRQVSINAPHQDVDIYKKVSSRLSLPFLRTNAWSFGTPFEGEYYDLVRKWFAMNESDPQCCPSADEMPRPDEIVWHYRNFQRERPKLVRDGFVEASPRQAVKYLFEPIAAKAYQRSDPAPTSIAMLSRFPSDLKAFANGLKKSPYDFQVRIIKNRTAASDFCFLRNTVRSLYIIHMSSFGGWAALLGNSPVNLYVIRDRNTKNRAARLNKTFVGSSGRREWVRQSSRFSLTILPGEDDMM
jgi:hypothetical protein